MHSFRCWRFVTAENSRDLMICLKRMAGNTRGQFTAGGADLHVDGLLLATRTSD
jgi:hypothetical protein